MIWVSFALLISKFPFLMKPEQKSEDVEIIKTGVKLPQGWPRTGNIKFENVVMKYAPHLPPALRGVSFSFKSGEKVWIGQ